MRPPLPRPRSKGSGKELAAADSENRSAIDSELWRQYFNRRILIQLSTTGEYVGNDNRDSKDAGHLLDGDSFNVYIAGDVRNTILLCLHGAGMTALSWALLAKRLKDAYCVIAYDCRGHGLTVCKDPENLDVNQLVQDGRGIVQGIRSLIVAERENLKREDSLTEESLPSEGPLKQTALSSQNFAAKLRAQSRQDGPCIVLMGHSLGGAIAVHMAASEGGIRNLQGLIVVDVVEGSAMNALSHIEHVVSQYPKSFALPDEGIEWSLRTNQVSNKESAAVSVPSQLVESEGHRWVWRVDRRKGQMHWRGWFEGISSKFLKANVGTGGRILMLAGTDRLDKDLTIAHMQGKFQLIVVGQSGHCIMEDQPDEVASALLAYGERFFLTKN